ncbi:hypothetical protein [Nocardia sp. BMG111209]|uniref:hypothetical protein n=1 Tax=Nocardia sp. BMG111209 TaxID=1160137 RepID=UPI0003A388DF|nr:hypothetical protein [Nocardia sp. BMG111209]
MTGQGVGGPGGGRSSNVDALEVDAGITAFSTLGDIRYSDAHLLRTDRVADRSAEQWARAILEEVPGDVRAGLERAWGSIGLQRSAFGADRSVAGWPIAYSCPEYVLLQAVSSYGFDGQLLFRCGESGVLVATFVQFREDGARAFWERAVAGHLRFVRSLLEARAG